MATPMVVLGRVTGLFGVLGWVRIYSHTSPRGNILSYKPWYIEDGGQWVERVPLDARLHGKGVIAQLDGCTNREQAALLVGRDLAVPRAQLPQPGADEYYWTDLEGLRVTTTDGVELGLVDHLFETGSNDVLVVCGDRERLIPFVRGEVVVAVDLDGGQLIVEWDPDF